MREVAAQATSLLLSNEALSPSTLIPRQKCSSLSPPAAASELLNAIAQVHRTSVIVWLESVRRLTGVDDSMSRKARLLSLSSKQTGETGPVDQKVPLLPLPLLRSFGEMLLSTKKMNDETFAVEKQNLYVDDIQEARRWANILTQLRPGCHGGVRAKATEIIAWIHEGLAVLIEELETPSTPGPVDWIAEPDATTLIIRLALVTKVQAKWYDCGGFGDDEAAALTHSKEQWDKIMMMGAQRLHPLALFEIRRSVFG